MKRGLATLLVCGGDIQAPQTVWVVEAVKGQGNGQSPVKDLFGPVIYVFLLGFGLSLFFVFVCLIFVYCCWFFSFA